MLVVWLAVAVSGNRLVPIMLVPIVLVWLGLFVCVVSIAGFLCGCRRVRFLVRWVW